MKCTEEFTILSDKAWLVNVWFARPGLSFVPTGFMHPCRQSIISPRR